jgi:hypothetical protein
MAGVAPLASAGGSGPSFGAMVLAGVAATAIVMWVRGKTEESRAEEEQEALLAEAEAAQRELDAHREDLSLAHDWTTSHPLALRYGQ